MEATETDTSLRLSSRQPKRVESLDALRLLAALLVFVQHYLSIMEVPVPRWTARGPLDSQAAVMLFFVLSGYVLAGSLTREAPSCASYIRFGIRRVLRLYPLYWCALLLTLLVYGCIMWSGGLGHDSEFIPRYFAAGAMDWRQWLLHLTMLDMRIDHEFFVPPVWTLLVEARIAVIFPLVAWVLLRCSWMMAMLFWLGLAVSAGWLGAHKLGIVSTLGVFVTGILLARIPRSFWQFTNKRWLLVLLAGAACYSAIDLRYDTKWLAHYACAAGAACIVAGAVYWQPLNDLLGRFQRVLRLDVSYGLYILHYPLIVGLLKLQLSGWVRLPPALGMALMLALTYAIAVVLHKIVELPAIRLGRHLTRKAPTT